VGAVPKLAELAKGDGFAQWRGYNETMEVNPYESPREVQPEPLSPRDYTGCLIWLAVAGLVIFVLYLLLPATMFAE
jgi:hypothetical protein